MRCESSCTTIDVKAQFSDLKAGHVDYLLSYSYQRIILLRYFSRKCYDYVVNCIFSNIKMSFFGSQ